jgi:hypothetical protein
MTRCSPLELSSISMQWRVPPRSSAPRARSSVHRARRPGNEHGTSRSQRPSRCSCCDRTDRTRRAGKHRDVSSLLVLRVAVCDDAATAQRFVKFDERREASRCRDGS